MSRESMWSWYDQYVQQHVLVSLDSGRRLRRPSSIGARPSSCSLSLAPPWLASHTKKSSHGGSYRSSDTERKKILTEIVFGFYSDFLAHVFRKKNLACMEY